MRESEKKPSSMIEKQEWVGELRRSIRSKIGEGWSLRGFKTKGNYKTQITFRYQKGLGSRNPRTSIFIPIEWHFKNTEEIIKTVAQLKELMDKKKIKLKEAHHNLFKPDSNFSIQKKGERKNLNLPNKTNKSKKNFSTKSYHPKSMEFLVPVILCGGSGSRLWPLSRASYPKQYLSLFSSSGETMLQQTQKRIKHLNQIDKPILICNEEHRFIAAEQLREINTSPKSIILEPEQKNTAPAITIAALEATENGDDPILLILSADHYIKNEDVFKKAIYEGIKCAERDNLVTFGITPNSPETGYGYIEAKEPLMKNSLNSSKISKFIEKPNLETAKKLVMDNRYTWNSGIFIFKASILLKEIEKYSPEILKFCKEAYKNNTKDLDFQRLDPRAFSKCPNISIDKAIMEKTKRGSVIPLDAGWSDIGSWESLWTIQHKNLEGNYISGKVVAENCKNSYLMSENRLVVGLGLSNVIVVETRDAVLIANKSKSQEIQKIVGNLKKNKNVEANYHRKIYRPWGHYTSVEEGSRWKVKRIEVSPGSTLSLQMHHHRAEHWIVVIGTAKVQIEEKELLLSENQSIYIPLGSRHRLSNPGKIPLVLIEVQSGCYLEEDDIIRFKDFYGRAEIKSF